MNVSGYRIYKGSSTWGALIATGKGEYIDEGLRTARKHRATIEACGHTVLQPKSIPERADPCAALEGFFHKCRSQGHRFKSEVLRSAWRLSRGWSSSCLSNWILKQRWCRQSVQPAELAQEQLQLAGRNAGRGNPSGHVVGFSDRPRPHRADESAADYV